jgi:hypothetical protein
MTRARDFDPDGFRQLSNLVLASSNGGYRSPPAKSRGQCCNAISASRGDRADLNVGLFVCTIFKYTLGGGNGDEHAIRISDTCAQLTGNY